VQLGIADVLARGPMQLGPLARAAGCHGPSLGRLLRALASIGLCEECSDGAFLLTAAGSVLLRDGQGSLRHWVMWCGRHLWSEWSNLIDSVRTGESARRVAKGALGLDHLDRDTEAAGVFDSAMAELTSLVAWSVAESYDFSKSRVVVDVGGGYGELLHRVLDRHPTLRGVLLDRPHAIDGARDRFRAAGLESRCEFVNGDFFDSVPFGADTYLLKSVIHDWDDKRSALILRNCHKAMRGPSRLLIIEQVMPDRVYPCPRHQDIARRDLTMLTGPGGRERTEAEFRRLVAASGFKCRRILPAALEFYVIDAAPG
jgi:hypothetical protein